MNEHKRKLAGYAATFCVNVASIGAGIAMFNENRLVAGIAAVTTLLIGSIILWRAHK